MNKRGNQKRPASRDHDAGVHDASLHRARQVIFARTLRDLRRSAGENRIISLPNLLRLYQRRLNKIAQDQPSAWAQMRTRLRNAYYRYQSTR